MPYFPDEVAVGRQSPGVRVQRAKRRRQHRIVTVVALAVALLALGTVKAWAHTIDVAVSPTCVSGKVYQDVRVNSQRGDYRFAGTASDSEGHSASVTLPAGGASTSVRLGPVSGSGSVRVVGDFYKESGRKAEHMDRTARYAFLADCKQEQAPPTTTTPTTAPPVKQPPKEETPKDDSPQVGTPTDTHRTPPSSTPQEEAAPPVKTTPPGELPFTGPEHPFGMNDLQWTLFLVSLGLFAGAAGLFWLGERRRFALAGDRRLVARATARAMAAEARDGRDPNVLADMVATGRAVRDRLLSR